MPFVLYTTLIAVVATAFSACTTTVKEDYRIWEELINGLVESNKLTRASNEDVFIAFEEKKFNPITKERASIWYPKAIRIKNASERVLKTIQRLKDSVLHTIDQRKAATGQDHFNLSNKNLQALTDELQGFRDTVLNVDERIKAEFETSLSVFSKNINTTAGSRHNFMEIMQSVKNKIQLIACATTLESKVLTITNKLVLFCFNNVGGMIEDYSSFSAIVGQNARILKHGDSLEITAGIGAIQKGDSASFIIAGKKVEVNDRYIANVKIKTANKLGTYSVPVTVSFKDQDGKPQTRTFNVEYTVVDGIKRKQ